jgi:preprotein translocase subunit SecD
MNSDIKNRLIILIAVLGVAIALLMPTVAKETFSSGWISKPLALGLDLKGGVYLVYQVETKQAVSGKLQTLAQMIKSEMSAQKVAILRPKVNDRQQLEVPLITDLSADKAKVVIQDKFPELGFLNKLTEEGRTKLVYGFSEETARRIERDSVTQSIETLNNRVNQFGVAEPLVQRAGEDRIVLQMPGASDIESVKRVVGSVAKLEFRLVSTGAGDNTVKFKNKDGGETVVEDQALLSGDSIERATVANDAGQVGVDFTLSKEGGRIFYKVTSENIGRQFAIILDNEVYSAPVIQGAIPGGRGQITGSFTFESARDLAVVLRSGALPAPLTVLEEYTIGPSLGKESIEKGVMAILIGFAFVIIFMVIYYKKSGLIAVASLALNLVLLLAVLSLFGATLTLPGLAGLALTIGMAVDSNVIIFERIRDELRVGATRDAAVAAGFEKALTAIIDSNVTTLLAGAILYYFGTGAIRGFAVSLSAGIITTIFCATFASRLGFDLFKMKSREGLSI